MPKVKLSDKKEKYRQIFEINLPKQVPAKE